MRLQERLWHPTSVKRGVEDEFRGAVLERARSYLEAGDAGLPLDEDRSTSVAADIRFVVLADHLGLTSPHLPGVAEYLQRYPQLDHPDVVESFLYWSKEAPAWTCSMAFSGVSCGD